MDELNVEVLLVAIQRELIEVIKRKQLDEPCMIGIRTGGVWLAMDLHEKLRLEEPVGELDISFYRDDFTKSGLNPTVKPSHLPFETENRNIILIDDVIMSGRTIRAAMNEIFDYGRPASITFVALIDLAKRELPIQPDIVGKHLNLNANEHIKLVGPESLRLEIREK